MILTSATTVSGLTSVISWVSWD